MAYGGKGQLIVETCARLPRERRKGTRGYHTVGEIREADILRGVGKVNAAQNFLGTGSGAGEANWEAILPPSFCVLSKTVSENGKKVKRKLKGKHKDMYAQTLEGDTKNIAHWWVRNGGAFDFGEYKLGDCTVHHGWLAHGAPPAPPKKGARTREAVVLRYMAAEGFVISPKIYDKIFVNREKWAAHSFDLWYAELAEQADKINRGMNFRYFGNFFPQVWPQKGLPFDEADLRPARMGMPAAPARQEEGQGEGQGEAEDKKTEL